MIFPISPEDNVIILLIIYIYVQEAWYAMHGDKEYVQKFMKPLYVGQIEEPAIKKVSIITNVNTHILNKTYITRDI